MKRLFDIIRRGYRGESFKVTLALYGGVCAVVVPIGVVLAHYFGDNVACPFVAGCIILVGILGLVQELRGMFK